MICNTCGTVRHQSDKRCSNCGAEFNKRLTKSSDNDKKQNHSLLLLIGMVIFMFLLTDGIIIQLFHYLYQSILVPFYATHLPAEYTFNPKNDATREIRLDHYFFHFVAIIAGVVQMVFYHILTKIWYKSENASKFYSIIYFIIPTIHWICLVSLVTYIPLNYEYNFLIIRIIIGGFLTGLLFHFFYRLYLSREESNIVFYSKINYQNPDGLNFNKR